MACCPSCLNNRCPIPPATGYDFLNVRGLQAHPPGYKPVLFRSPSSPVLIPLNNPRYAYGYCRMQRMSILASGSLRGVFERSSSVVRVRFGTCSTLVRAGFDSASTALRGCSVCNALRSEDLRTNPRRMTEAVPKQGRTSPEAGPKRPRIKTIYYIS